MSSSVTVGTRVAVAGRDGEGTVRFVGQTEFGEGTFVGVELEAPTGKNDGSKDGVVYFACPPKHGIFVKPERVRPVLAQRASRFSVLGSAALPPRHSEAGSTSGQPSLAQPSLGQPSLGQPSLASRRALPPRISGERVASSSSHSSVESATPPATRARASSPDDLAVASNGFPAASGGGFGSDFADSDAILAAAIAASERDESEREAELRRRERDELLAAMRASRTDAATADEPIDLDNEEDIVMREFETAGGGGSGAAAAPGLAALYEAQARHEPAAGSSANFPMGSLQAPPQPGNAFFARDDDDDDDDDPMLAAALAMSRSEAGVAPPAQASPLDAAAATARATELFGEGGALAQRSRRYRDVLGDPFGDLLSPLGSPEPLARPLGGLWSETLRAVSAEAMEIASLREGDKVMLPPSTLQTLMNLIPSSAMPHPLLFRLRVAGTEGGGHHVGVLEFSAPEGAVIMPLWLMRTLGVDDSCEMLIETAELRKGTFAKLQPLCEEFCTLEDPKGTLEQCITGVFTTLTKGDSISIWHAGVQLELFVVELQADGEDQECVCVVDTELEVDFLPSVINEEEQRRRAQELALEAEQRRVAAAALAQAQAQATAAEQAAAAAAREEEERKAAEEAAESRKVEREEATSALPDEPAAGPEVTTVLVRMPDGPRISRRFEKGSTLQLVRMWVEASSPAERPMRHFDLISNHPRFVASTQNGSQTLNEAGLHPQATFFVKETLEE